MTRTDTPQAQARLDTRVAAEIVVEKLVRLIDWPGRDIDFESASDVVARALTEARREAITDYWAAHYLNDQVGLCSLCGNSGYLHTTYTAVSAAGVNAGRVNFCLCPNGQALRQRASA